MKGASPGGQLECHADLPGLWYVGAYHEGYKETMGAVHRRRIVAIKEGPILIVDNIEGGQGHTAGWNFHTPLDAVVERDRSVTLKGRETYQLVPAHADELTDTKTKRHWAAVLPRDCQPDDCGTEVTGLSFEKPITAEGARFTVALFEGSGSIREEPEGVFRLGQGDRQYVVLCGDREAILNDKRISAEGRLAVILFVAGRPVRAWVVEGRKPMISGRDLLTAGQPVTKEMAVEF